MCRAMLSRSFIQFSVAGQDCVPSLLFELRLHHGGGNEDHGDLRQKAQCTHYRTQCPQPCSRHCQPTPLLESPGHSQASLVQSPVGSLLLSPRPCCAHGFVCALHASVSLALCKFCSEIPLASQVKFPGSSPSLCQIPRLGNLL